MHWMPQARLYPPYLRSRIKAGRGVGEGVAYRPWFRVRDVPSRGTSSSVLGIKVPRAYQSLSELQTTYFFLTERRASTVDVREHWPILDIDGTLELCAQLGVPHGYRGTFPEPFTITFLVTERVNDRLVTRAASVTTREDAADPAIRRRLAVEHAWCARKGIAWTLVDTSAFDKTLLSSLRFVRSWFRNRCEPDDALATRFVDGFNTVYQTNMVLGELTRRVAKLTHTPADIADDTFRYCAWSGRIDVSLLHPISLDAPLILRRSQARA